MTSDLKARVNRHNDGRERTTRAYKPFELVYSEFCEDRKMARNKEKYWKSSVGKEKLRELRNK